ncbi:MAG TPA: GNAT family N-acetyltransferase [Ktedonobacteraceae bacterium]|nr:GNAT family N-acetyltransferase [Ktedonobacteraceae bacterium]
MDATSFTREDAPIRVRPYVPADEAFVFGLAPRLLVGIAPWRNPERMLVAVQRWLEDSMKQHGTQTALFIAEDERGERLGVASVSHEHHFTGEEEAYIGELATNDAAEGRGVGRILVAACEQWAREHGYAFLTLHTGAANERARGFYRHLGFQEEDVKLVKPLSDAS